MAKKLLFLLLISMSTCFVYGMKPSKAKETPITIYEYYGLDSRFGDSAIKDVRIALAKKLMNEKQWWYPKQLGCAQDSVAHTVAYSSDGALLATASTDKTLRLWDRRGKNVVTKQYPCAIIDLAAHPSESFLITALDNKTLDKVDFKGESVKIVRCASKPTALAINAKGTHVATVSSDGLLRVWPLDGGKLIQSGHAIGDVSGVEFYPDGNVLATAHSKWVYVWEYGDAGIGPLVRASNDHSPVQFSGTGTMTTAAFQRQGHLLATACQDGSVSLWDIAWEKVRDLPCKNLVKLLGFDRTGTLVAAACHDDRTHLNVTKGQSISFGVPDRITLWHTQNGHEVATLLQEDQVQSFAFHPQSNRLAVACENKAVKIWKRHETPTLELILIRLMLKGYLTQCILERKKPERPAERSNDDVFAAWMARMFNLNLVKFQDIVRHLPDGPRKSMIKTYIHRAKNISLLQGKIAAQQAEKAKWEQEERRREWQEKMRRSKAGKHDSFWL